MQTLNLTKLNNFSELSNDEITQIDGGSFWRDLAYFVGVVVYGYEVFATEGGRNAGLCVR